jgi:isopenicillin-N N-acyltransferase like protein
MQAKEKTFFRRRSVKIAIGFLVVILALVIWFAIVAIDRPPVISNRSALNVKRIDWGNNTYSYGNSWLRKSESGLWESYIEGAPFERGVAFGQLTMELLYYQESSFFEQIRALIPSDGYLRVLKYFIAFFNRNLDKNITPEYKEEIYGTSFACAPEYDFIGSGYQRQLNYHAAHDIGHALQGLNMVACTSFSVWNSKSADYSVLIGRNFDFYMGEKFAENKIVCFVNPSRGYKFMMITWADMIGVVSGMNEKGLTVTLNAAKSSIPLQAATPVTLLAREILQYASNIQEAYSIAQKRKLFVSESIMIGSSQDHYTAIIEKSPDNMDLFKTNSGSIICSNHFQGKAFANDKKNIENIHGSDSYKRFQRVGELMGRYPKMDVIHASAVLRDQRTLGDSIAGMGNQLAINQLIAHHSVIFKPDSLIVWVSTAPWQLGRYVAYDLKKIFKLGIKDICTYQEIYSASLTIPADSFLQSPDYRNYLVYQQMTRQIKQIRSIKGSLPEGFEKKYRQSNPALYLTYVNLGDYFGDKKDYKMAALYYSLALHCKLPGLDERDKLLAKSQEFIKKANHGHSGN